MKVVRLSALRTGRLYHSRIIPGTHFCYPGGGEIFRNCPDRPWGPPSLLYNGYWVFPGGKDRPGRDADTSPPSSAVGHKRVELYLYSPYGLYNLYRASVPVQGWPLLISIRVWVNSRDIVHFEVSFQWKISMKQCRWSWKSRAIPLLPLWAVRPVQSLSACTRVHFIFTFSNSVLSLGKVCKTGPNYTS